MNTFDLLSMKGKNVLITGGRAMYGLGATLALADAGANIYLASHTIESAQPFIEEPKTITVLNGYDPNWNHDYSMLDWQNEDGNSMIDEIIGFDFLELLKEHDGVFIDTAAIQERYMEWDGEGDFNVSDLVKPYNY